LNNNKKEKGKSNAIFHYFRSSSNKIIEKNIIVFIDDIGQLKPMNTTYIYSLRKIDMYRQTNMNKSSIQLDDLPDEILVHIFKKLYNNEVLYSLIGVNQRLNRIVHDPIFTHNLYLLKYCPDDNSTEPLPDPILERFCSKILPEIRHQVTSLCLETTSVERILHATNYPNLNHLGLYDINYKVAKTLFLGKRFSLIDFIVELNYWKTKSFILNI
jgi:hypothetical protein